MSTPGTRSLVGKMLVKVREKKGGGAKAQAKVIADPTGFLDQLGTLISDAKAAVALVGKDNVKQAMLMADEASKLAKTGKQAQAQDKLDTARAMLSTHRDAASQAEYPQLQKRLAKRFEAIAAADAAKLPQEAREAFEARRAAIAQVRQRAEQQFEGRKFSDALSMLSEAGELASEAIGALPKRADSAAPMDKKLAEGIALPDGYKGEDKTGVKYYGDKERAATADHVDPLTGKIKDAEGQLKDTRTLKSDTGDVLRHGRDMYVKDHDRGTTHSFQEEKGRSTGEQEHHSSAPAGGKVDAAGRRVIEGGVLRRVDGDSGHYKPKTEHIHKYLKEQIDLGVKMIDDEALTIRGKDGKDSPAGPDAAGLYKTWKTYDQSYHDLRRLALSSGEPPAEYDKSNPYAPDMLALRQRLQDMGVAPKMSDATVEALKAKNWNTQQEFDAIGSDPNKEARLLKMLESKIGPTAWRRSIKGVHKGELPLTDAAVKNQLLKWGDASDWTSITLDGWNKAIGVFLRVHWDVPYAADAKSQARVEMKAEQFAQTGGNVAAIEAKAAAGAFVQKTLAAKLPLDKDQAKRMAADAGAGDAEIAALAKEAADATKKSPQQQLQERFTALGGADKLRRIEKDWGLAPYDIQLPLDGQVAVLDGSLGKSQFEAHQKAPDEFIKLGGEAALKNKESAWGLALHELSALDMEDRVAVLQDRLGKDEAVAKLGPKPVPEAPAQKKYREAMERKLAKLGGVARLEELGVADAKALSLEAQLDRFRDLAHTAVAQNPVLVDSDKKETDEQHVERLYGELKGDKILKELGVDPSVFSMEQRFEIACKKRVPPHHLAQAYGTEPAYQKLGGDVALASQLGVVNAASFSPEEKLDMLARGFVPTDKMVQAFGDIGMAIAKLGGDVRLKELGAPYPANLSDIQKFEILAGGAIPPKYLMAAHGGPAGVEEQLKALFQARGMDTDLSMMIPEHERLRLVLSKHLGDFVEDIKLGEQKLQEYKALGGPAAMRTAVEKKIEALNLPKDIAATVSLNDMKEWLENDKNVPSSIKKAAKERATEQEVATIGSANIRSEVVPLILAAGVAESEFDKMSAKTRLKIYKAKALSADIIVDLKGGLKPEEIKQKVEIISPTLRAKNASAYNFDNLSSELKLMLMLGTAKEDDLKTELDWAFKNF